MDMKSEAQATPASVKQSCGEEGGNGSSVSRGGMGGCSKSTPRICYKAVSSLQVDIVIRVYRSSV